MRISGVLLCLLMVPACQRTGSTTRAVDAPDAGNVGCPPNAFIAAPVTTPWYVNNPPSQCVQNSTHDQPQLLDDCNLPGFQPDICAIPQGSWVCEGNSVSNQGHFTLLCKVAGDCPDGWTCQGGDNYKTCQKTCTGTVANECIRCDLSCQNGTCQPAPLPPGPPCTADCECEDGVCAGGHCDSTLRTSRAGICGEDCPCNGGTCGLHGPGQSPLCCYKSDGTIATPADRECQR